MPQFDFYSFSTQIFWVLVSFSFFYFYVLFYYLCRLAEVLKMRRKLALKVALRDAIKKHKIPHAVVDAYYRIIFKVK